MIEANEGGSTARLLLQAVEQLLVPVAPYLVGPEKGEVDRRLLENRSGYVIMLKRRVLHQNDPPRRGGWSKKRRIVSAKEIG